MKVEKINLYKHFDRKYWSYQLAKQANGLLKTGALLLLLVACKTAPEKSVDLNKIDYLVKSGEIKKAEMLADSIKANGNLVGADRYQLDSIIEIGRRIRLDFRLNETDVKNRLSKYFPVLDTALFSKWIETKKLEMRVIDGERHYFNNAVPNLFRLDDEARKSKIKVEGFQVDSLNLFCLQHTTKIISETKISGEPVVPVQMKLTYHVTVDANAVPDGKIIRCWMPFPKEGNERQKNSKLLSSDPENALVAPENHLQRTVYLEKPAVKDQPTKFRIEFEVETSAQYFDLNPEEIKPYNTESEIFKANTGERAPQILFTPKIRQLANRILAGETNPLKKAQKIYHWINDSVRWASALEYSIIPDIPGYVMETHHGDCGMQTLLFMTLVRSQGIPAKWQSGWMLHPRHTNLHDWCEVYFEGIGWVPVDQSFGLQDSQDVKVRNFYSSGIDSYRMIVNDDYGRKLFPEKKFPRSEPYDFQRGELEWEGGNLYFDKWDWHMEVEYK